jgi:hypothetical protein
MRAPTIQIQCPVQRRVMRNKVREPLVAFANRFRPAAFARACPHTPLAGVMDHKADNAYRRQ